MTKELEETIAGTYPHHGKIQWTGAKLLYSWQCLHWGAAPE